MKTTDLSIFKNSNYRDLAIISVTATLGAFLNLGVGSGTVDCRWHCGVAYGTYVGIGFDLLLHGINYYMERAQRLQLIVHENDKGEENPLAVNNL